MNDQPPPTPLRLALTRACETERRLRHRARLADAAGDVTSGDRLRDAARGEAAHAIALLESLEGAVPGPLAPFLDAAAAAHEEAASGVYEDGARRAHEAGDEPGAARFEALARGARAQAQRLRGLLGGPPGDPPV